MKSRIVSTTFQGQKTLVVIYALSVAYATAWGLVVPLIPLYLAAQGASANVVGAVVGVSGIPPLLLAVPVGILADKYGPRFVATGSAIIYVLGSAILAMQASAVGVTLAFALVGLGNMALVVACQTLVAQSSTPSERVTVYGRFAFWNLAGIVTGPILGGFVVDVLGYQAAFFVVLSLALIALILTTNLRGERQELRQTASRWMARTSARQVLISPGIGLALFITFTIVSVQSLKLAFYPLYLQNVGLSTTLIGLAVAAEGLASMAVRPLINRIISWLGYRVLLMVTTSIALVAIGVTPLLETLFPLIVASALMGISVGFTQPVTLNLMTQTVTSDLWGLALGFRMTTHRLANVVSPIAFGLVVVGLGMSAAFFLGALMLFGALPVISHLAKHVGKDTLGRVAQTTTQARQSTRSDSACDAKDSYDA